MILISCRLKLAFSTPKLEYAKHFILKLHFKTDGYYESSQFRSQFVEMLDQLQKQNKSIVLGGDSFPFGISTFFINCDESQIAQKLARQNVFVQKGLANPQIEEVQRISTYKFGNIANFYQMKIPI